MEKMLIQTILYNPTRINDEVGKNFSNNKLCKISLPLDEELLKKIRERKANNNMKKNSNLITATLINTTL